MPAAQSNLLIEIGANLNLVVNLQDSTGANVDLTGYSAKFQVRGHIGDASPVLSLDSAGLGGITMGGTAGTITLAATAAQTKAISIAALDPSLVPTFVAFDGAGNQVVKTGYKAPYSLEITDSNWTSGNITRVLEGYAVITPEVVQ
jgi:hypothetical protein